MAHDPMRDDLDVSSELGEDLDDSTTGELADLELVDVDQPEAVVGLMATDGVVAPDPANIASRLADTDVDDIIGHDDPAPAAPRKGKPQSLEKRLSFDHVPQPKSRRRAERRSRRASRSWFGRLLDRLFGRNR